MYFYTNLTAADNHSALEREREAGLNYKCNFSLLRFYKKEQLGAMAGLKLHIVA